MGGFPGGRADAKRKSIRNELHTLNRPNHSKIAIRGVTLQAIRNMVDEAGGNPEGRELVDKFIIPRTAKQNCSWAELLPRNQCGTVNIFVCHAWKYPVKKLVSALEEFERTTTLKPPFFYFLDYCTVNQHNVNKDLQNNWNCIQSCKATVLVLSPWSDPIPLKRCWCILEIMQTILADETQLEVVLPSAETEELRRSHLTSVAKVLSKIDSAKAVASQEYDQIMIQKWITDKLGGFLQVNDAVLKELRNWLDKTVDKILRDWADKKGRSYRTFLNNAALYFRRRANFERAISLHEELVMLDEQDNAEPTRRQIMSKKNLATALRSQAENCIQEGETENKVTEILLRAKKIYEDSIDLSDTYLTESRSLKPNMLSHLAGVHELLGNLDIAEKLCRDAVDGFENHKQDHPNRLVCLCSLAQILAKQEKYDEAEKWFGDALSGLRNKLGERHMWTLNGEFSHGCHLLLRAIRDTEENSELSTEGIKKIKGCKEGMIETLGLNHPKTKRCEEILELIKAGPLDRQIILSFFSRSNIRKPTIKIEDDQQDKRTQSCCSCCCWRSERGYINYV